MGLGLDQVANAITNANVQSPTGAFNGDGQGVTIATDDQLNTPEDYRGIVVASKNGAVVRLGDVATVERGVRNRLAAGWYNGKPAVILVIFKQPGANVIETVDAIKALLPKLQQWIPQGIDISVLVGPHADDPLQHRRHSTHAVHLGLSGDGGRLPVSAPAVAGRSRRA